MNAWHETRDSYTLKGATVDSDGGLWELATGYILAGEVGELDGLRPVRVVDQ